MKITEGLKLTANKNGRVEIPDTKRRDLPHFFVDQGYKIGAEIGVYRGHFSRHLLKQGAKVYSIDPWLSYPDYINNNPQEKFYQDTKDLLSPYPNSTIIRKTSMDALDDFEDESLDFVYIDGHHGFKYVTEDIWEWSKKVRKGGVISGHDYKIRAGKRSEAFIIHTKFVVDAYVKALGIKKWYILGREDKVDGESRDSFRSWMWIKE